MKIKKRLVILFLPIALVPLLIVGIFGFIKTQNSLENQILSGLESVTDSRIADITHLVQLRQEQCKELAGTFSPRQLESNGENDSVDIINIQAHIESILEEMKLNPGSNTSSINQATEINLISVWDRNGEQIANTNNSLTDVRMSDHYLQNVMDKGSFFGGYQLDSLTNEKFLIFLQAIRDYEDKEFAGIILFKVKADMLNEVARNRTGLGETGEVLIAHLIDDNVFFMSDLLHSKKPPTVIIGTDNAVPIQQAVTGIGGNGISMDYRGEEILAVWRHIPILNWGIVAKIDTAEAYAPIYEIRNLMILFGVLIAFIIIIIAIRISKTFSRPISEAVKIAEGVAQGDLQFEINIHGVQEINELGEALKKMQQSMLQTAAVAVAASNGDFKQKVEIKSEKDEMAIAINKMMHITKDKLWIEKGMREVSAAILEQNEIISISENLLNQIVPYLKAQVGAIYVLDDEDGLLKYTAGYAFKKIENGNYNLQIGEGLAGQAAKEKKVILFKDIPKDYLTINSGLGESSPKNILTIPFITKNELKGVMEIGSKNEFSNLQQNLLENLGENIASAINAAQSKVKIHNLFKNSQAQNKELQASKMELLEQQRELETIKIELEQQIGCLNETAIVSEADADGNITFVNDNFCELSGYKREELIGKNHRILKSGKQSDGLFVGVWKAISLGRVWKGKVLNKKKGGKGYYWMDTTIMPFKDIKGNVIKYVAIRFDITDQIEQQEKLKRQAKELLVSEEELTENNNVLEAQARKLQASEEELKAQQEELLQSNQELEEKGQLLEEKNASVNEKNTALENAKIELQEQTAELERTSRYKSEFLANMSHELRTPLNSILLLSKLMSDNTNQNLTPDQIEFSKVIHNSGNGLLELINEILDLSKIESGKMELHIEEVSIENIKSNLIGMLSPIASSKGIKFTVEIDKNAFDKITTDRLRLGQVLKNLLSNAVKFTRKGNVTLRVYTPVKRKNFQKTTLKPGEVIAFEVTDTGIGIPQDKLQLIFEPFQQADGSTRRQYGGTGLGLSISREIVDLLGGELVLESTEGKGSSFTLYLPINGKETILVDDTSHVEIEQNDNNEVTNIANTNPNTITFTPKEIPDDIPIIEGLVKKK